MEKMSNGDSLDNSEFIQFMHFQERFLILTDTAVNRVFTEIIIWKLFF